MLCVNTYINDLIALLKKEFGQRLVYVGLQGSYLRGEATEESDIDVMVVIDKMTVADLGAYRQMILSLPNPEKSCGFICGKEDLAHWSSLEIFHLLHSTKDYYGTLADLVPPYQTADVVNYIKMSVGNTYHEACHRYLFADKDKNRQELPSTYRNVFFILQNVCYLRDGVFYGTKKEMLPHLQGLDRQVLEMLLTLSDEAVDLQTYDLEVALELLLGWCQQMLATQ